MCSETYSLRDRLQAVCVVGAKKERLPATFHPTYTCLPATTVPQLPAIQPLVPVLLPALPCPYLPALPPAWVYLDVT